MAAEHVPRHHVVAVSSSDMTITLWSDTIYEFVGTMHPSPAQTCMRYLSPIRANADSQHGGAVCSDTVGCFACAMCVCAGGARGQAIC